MMNSCGKSLTQAVRAFFRDEPDVIVEAVSHALARILEEGKIGAADLRALPEGGDALLLMDEWRLVQPVGASATKAWEDTSQILSMGGNFDLDFPAWVHTLIRRACDTGAFQFRRALLTFFSDEGHPAWLKMPPFLFEMARRSDHGVTDSSTINRLLRETPLGITADTLIARLKSYGIISPHLRADFFRMRTPHYEIHPLLVHAAKKEEMP